MNGSVVWMTGLPASGKSTLAARLHERLRARGVCACVLDSDEIRDALCPRAGFGVRARADFYEALGNLAALLARQGSTVLVAATASRRRFRDRVRERVPRFVEVYVDTDVDECAKRDRKGLYERSRAGEISGLPGVDAEYEPPASPDIIAHGGLDERALEELEARVARADDV